MRYRNGKSGMRNSLRGGMFSGSELLVLCCGLVCLHAEGIKASPLSAVPIKLAWDASPDVRVTGYALYYGPADSSVTNRLDLATTQTVTLNGLDAGSNYYFYVVSYTAEGIESEPSNVLFYRPPALSRLQLSSQADGSMRIQFRSAPDSDCQIECTSGLDGDNWQPLASATADTNGNVVVYDSASGRPPVRFYRGLRR